VSKKRKIHPSKTPPKTHHGPIKKAAQRNPQPTGLITNSQKPCELRNPPMRIKPTKSGLDKPNNCEKK
jgi:hypothetical protein